jgi:hypothetical protein
VRHAEYLERQAARAARDDVVKPKKFEHEVSSWYKAIQLEVERLVACVFSRINAAMLGACSRCQPQQALLARSFY